MLQLQQPMPTNKMQRSTVQLQFQPQSQQQQPSNIGNNNRTSQIKHISSLLTSNASTYCAPSSPSSTLSSIISPLSSSGFATDSMSSCTSSVCSSSASTSTSASSIGVNLRVTGQCSQGGRKYMEDFFSVAYQQADNSDDLEYAFIGIYDGHGGAEAAAFAKEHLMLEIIKQKQFWSDDDKDVLRAIREGYIATHYAMWREQSKWPKTSNGLPSTAGTTATIAFVRHEKIYIGHVGDSGIVLGYQNEGEHFWRAKQLTTDHKPESVQERKRILRSGGKVVVKSGVPRVVWNRPRNAAHKGPIRRNTPVVQIPFLAVARSLGDLWSYNSARNEFVVSPDPDVRVIRINPKTFKCLIFGTDGLWNVVTPQKAVDLVRSKELLNERLKTQHGDSPAEGQQWTNPSKGLVDRAIQTWSVKKMRADNTSVVTVVFKSPNVNSRSRVDSNTRLCSMDSVETPSSAEDYSLDYVPSALDLITFDDVTTYHELAMKHLPPEEFRNFNYYDDDDDDSVDDDNDDVGKHKSHAMLINHTHLEDASMQNASYSNAYADINHGNYNWHFDDELHDNSDASWAWQQQQQSSYQQRPQVVAAAQQTTTTATDTPSELQLQLNEIKAMVKEFDYQRMHERSEEEDEYIEEHNEEEDSDTSSDAEEEHAVAVKNKMAATSFCNFSPNTSSCSVMNIDEYMNSFAESYNSLLSEHISSDADGSSNSEPCYQSVSSSSMSELIQEQQLYQQQCMSQEEGYSLTKLETRGEQQQQQQREQQQQQLQQQNFKVLPQNGMQLPTETAYLLPATVNASQQVWNARLPSLSTALNRFLSYQQQQQQQQQQQHQQQQSSSKPLELNSLLQQEREEEQQVALERAAMQRMLQNAEIAANCDAQQQQRNTAAALNDETVQINEISSSMSEQMHEQEVTQKHKSEHMLRSRTQQQQQQQQQQHQQQQESSKAKLQKIAKSLGNVSSSEIKQTYSGVSVALNSTLRPRLSSGAVVKRNLSAQFPNEPNENKIQRRETMLESNRKSRRFMPYQRTNAEDLQQRQLRSNVNQVDNTKRTLRTRNMLSKDMKVKAANVNKRNNSNNNTCISNSSSSSNNSSSGKGLSKAAAVETVQHLKATKTGNNTNNAVTIGNFAHVINLRSRQIAQSVLLAATTASNMTSSSNYNKRTRVAVGSSSNATPSPALNGFCQGRSLRSLQLKTQSFKEQSPTISTSPNAITSSKTMRMQLEKTAKQLNDRRTRMLLNERNNERRSSLRTATTANSNSNLNMSIRMRTKK